MLKLTVFSSETASGALLLCVLADLSAFTIAFFLFRTFSDSCLLLHYAHLGMSYHS